MKIEFEVPQWAIGKHIHIFAGAELLGNKECRIVHRKGMHITEYLPLKIKPDDGRCIGCGDCCQILSNKDSHFLKTMREVLLTKNLEDGSCPFYSNEGCILKSFIPFSCLRSVCTNIGNCNEKLIEVE